MLFNFLVKDPDGGGRLVLRAPCPVWVQLRWTHAGMTNDSEPRYYRWRNSVLSDFSQNGSINVNNVDLCGSSRSTRHLNYIPQIMCMKILEESHYI